MSWCGPIRYVTASIRVGPAARACPLGCRVGRRVDREHVVPVDQDAGEPVAPGAPNDRRRGLACERDGDRPPVALAEEHDGKLEHSGDIRGLMEIALGCRSLTEVGQGACVLTVELRAHRPAGRVDQLCRERHADGREPGRYRIVRSAVPGPAVVLEILDLVDAAGDRCRQFPERGEDEILGPERERAPDLSRLLSFERRVDGQLPVALEGHALTVHSPSEDHQPKQLAQLVVAKPDLRVACPLPVRGDQLQHGWIVGGRSIEGHGGGTSVASGSA